MSAFYSSLSPPCLFTLLKPKGERDCQLNKKEKKQSPRGREVPTGRLLTCGAQTDAQPSAVWAGSQAGAASSLPGHSHPEPRSSRHGFAKLPAPIPFGEIAFHQKCALRGDFVSEQRALGSQPAQVALQGWVPGLPSPCHLCCCFLASNLHFLFLVTVLSLFQLHSRHLLRSETLGLPSLSDPVVMSLRMLPGFPVRHGAGVTCESVQRAGERPQSHFSLRTLTCLAQTDNSWEHGGT